MQDLYDRMGRMEICQDAIERMEYRQSYHWDRYHGVFENMAGVLQYDVWKRENGKNTRRFEGINEEGCKEEVSNPVFTPKTDRPLSSDNPLLIRHTVF
ncbi:hypothetical protein Tco_0492751 [Tanacetum coccineum]